MAKSEDKTRCPVCGIKHGYWRVDGTFRCQRCGFDSRRDPWPEKEEDKRDG